VTGIAVNVGVRAVKCPEWPNSRTIVNMISSE
jgi:hypothetical protein